MFIEEKIDDSQLTCSSISKGSYFRKNVRIKRPGLSFFWVILLKKIDVESRIRFFFPANKNYLIVFSFLVSLFACGEKPCYEETEVYLNVSFETLDTAGQVQDTIFDSLFVTGIGSNYRIKYTGGYDFLLDLNRDTTGFILDFNEIGNSDNVVFSYQRKAHLVSHECGFAMFFDSLKVIGYTKNVIDSVKIISNTVDEFEHENVKIYL